MQKYPGNVTKYVYGLGLIGEETNGSFKTYHFDLRGSTVVLTDENCNVTDTFEYDTYGKLTARTGSTATPFLCNGRDGVITEANGLYYMRARYYSPVLKRFINADLVAGDISNAVTLNRYAYANCNPVSNIDPLGLSVERGKEAISNFKQWIDDLIDMGPTMRLEKIVNELMKVQGATAEFRSIALSCILNTQSLANFQYLLNQFINKDYKYGQQNAGDPYLDGFIIDQNGDTGKRYGYGCFPAKHNACEAIAIYNAAHYFGSTVRLEDILYDCTSSYKMIAGGFFGTNVYGLGPILDKNYLRYENVGLDQINQMNGMYIVSYWNDANDISRGVHTIAVGYNEDEDKFMGYNYKSGYNEFVASQFDDRFICGYYVNSFDILAYVDDVLN